MDSAEGWWDHHLLLLRSLFILPLGSSACHLLYLVLLAFLFPLFIPLSSHPPPNQTTLLSQSPSPVKAEETLAISPPVFSP